MRPLKHILVVVDPTTETQYCVEKGARLARAVGASLELCICDLTDVFASRFAQGEAHQAVLTRRRMALEAKLTRLAEPVRQSGISVLTDVVFHDALHVGVIQKVLASRADLVIKDTRYHTAISRTLFSNSDWQLIRKCPVPLLLTKAGVWHPRFRVAAALDPAHPDDKPAVLDRQLLEVTEALAAHMHGEALAVHAFDALPLISGMAVGSTLGGDPIVDFELVSTLRQLHDKEFRTLLAGRTGLNGHVELIDGSPVTVLPAYVTRMEIDVLVTGAVSRSAARRMLVGNTAERLLDRLPCDILVVKPPAHSNLKLAS